MVSGRVPPLSRFLRFGGWETNREVACAVCSRCVNCPEYIPEPAAEDDGKERLFTPPPQLMPPPSLVRSVFEPFTFTANKKQYAFPLSQACKLSEHVLLCE